MSVSVKFIANISEFENDYLDIVRAFDPHIKLSEGGEALILDLSKTDELNYVCNVKYSGEEFRREISIDTRFLESPTSCYYGVKYRAQVKRLSKVALYDFLSYLTGVSLPYGSLTGIRPTKLYREISEKGIDSDGYFLNTLRVSERKLDLIKSIAFNQSRFYNIRDNEIDLFVNIPICVSRCVYCSFISAQLDKVKNLVSPYCDVLIKELETSAGIVKNNGLKVRSVYIGGGTPTSLDDVNFERVIRACALECREFTVEAGRPDAITKEKLDIMKRYGVTRISVNPQTFNQRTLDLIGRSHSVEDIYRVYDTARGYGFDINMDLIAMLPKESVDDFKFSVDCAIALDPENITVHTLALKKGSTLKLDGYESGAWENANAMVDYAYDALGRSGYSPYYMYKQKYMSGNLENVGYCKDGKACVYNIDIMEEIASIVANGAGGISKRIFDGGRLERLANPKGLEVYVEREKKIIEGKIKFFE